MTEPYPYPLKIVLNDPFVGHKCLYVLIDWKPKYGMAEYESTCSGRTVMLTPQEAWEHAAP